ncbi:hypothetical protein M5X17_31085 [Paenibacillus alvei]|uniref:hypothetical protein n=1 Tax=Paenibacillus alvei TaxID=44250 RepID=UPI002281B482|nr:hypothetical protein [Paenibacillus alvei]MCY9738138.1 hypothetical protein [Paenibacillus alvei]
MRTLEFESRKNNLGRYFNNENKWKRNEEGDFIYYKGKRNLKELKYIIELMFGDVMTIISEDYFKTEQGKVIGGSIIGKVYVNAEMNGMYQGTAGADVYIRFTLWEHGYFTNQASQVEYLDTY